MGRTAWFVTSLSVADYHTFIDDTASRGYTAIEFHVINHDLAGNNPPFNGNGDQPFLKRLDGTAWTGLLGYRNINAEAPDFTTPNEAYWSSVDGFLAYCESKGLLVFMFPAYVGFQGGSQGWMQEIVANGPTKHADLWRLDRGPLQEPEESRLDDGRGHGHLAPRLHRVPDQCGECATDGLKSVAGQQSTLFSAEWASDSIATDQATFGTSMTLNGAYSFAGDVNNHGRRAYASHAGHAGVPARGAVRRRRAGRERRQWQRHPAGATVPVVGLAVHDRRLHRRQWLCLAVQRASLAQPPEHARVARHGAPERLYHVPRLVQARSLGPERDANARHRRTLVGQSKRLRGGRGAPPMARCWWRTFHPTTAARSPSTWAR